MQKSKISSSSHDRDERAIPASVIKELAENNNLSSKAIHLYLKLLCEADAIGEIHSLLQSKLSQQLNFDPKTTTKALNKLEESKFIAIEKSGNGTSFNFFILQWDRLFPWAKQQSDGINPETIEKSPMVLDNQQTNQLNKNEVGIAAGIRLFKKMLEEAGPVAQKLLYQAEDLFNYWSIIYPSINIVDEVNYSLKKWATSEVKDKHRKDGLINWIVRKLRFEQNTAISTLDNNSKGKGNNKKESKVTSPEINSTESKEKPNSKLEAYLKDQRKELANRAA